MSVAERLSSIVPTGVREESRQVLLGAIGRVFLPPPQPETTINASSLGWSGINPFPSDERWVSLSHPRTHGFRRPPEASLAGCYFALDYEEVVDFVAAYWYAVVCGGHLTACFALELVPDVGLDHELLEVTDGRIVLTNFVVHQSEGPRSLNWATIALGRLG